MNVYIFQSGVFEDQINMKSLTWALVQHDIRQGETGEDGSVKMESETKDESNAPQAKEHTWKSQGRVLCQSLQGNPALATPWLWDSVLHNYERVNFCFKPPIWS